MAKAKRGRTKGRRFRVIGGPFNRYENPIVTGKCGVIICCTPRTVLPKKILISHPTHYPAHHEFTILKEGEFTVAMLRDLKKLGRLKELPARKKKRRGK